MATFTFRDVISVKHNGRSFTKEQINWLIDGVVSGQVDPSQIGSFLTAVFLKGMSDEETSQLTLAMMNSGQKLSWPPSWSAPVVDKHSTGGVGDKVSLPLIGALMANGVKVPMMSGRSLGHTGGTLDKLESIPGFSVNLTPDQITSALESVGGCIVSQTKEIVPADRVMYAVRDVTGTVACLPLIVSSIVSKKAAEGISSLVLDVKTGKGSFLKALNDSRQLAAAMISVCVQLGIKVAALITDMNSPLGNTIGNALEVCESIDVMKGNGPSDVEELVCIEGGHLLWMSGKALSLEAGQDAMRRSLYDGSALDAFKRMTMVQGTEAEVAERLCRSPRDALRLANHRTTMTLRRGGVVTGIDPMACAHVSCGLGAGRAKAGDVIDHGVGIELTVHVGDRVSADQTWAVLYHRHEALPARLAETMNEAITVEDETSVDMAKLTRSRLVEVVNG